MFSVLGNKITEVNIFDKLLIDANIRLTWSSAAFRYAIAPLLVCRVNPQRISSITVA